MPGGCLMSGRRLRHWANVKVDVGHARIRLFYLRINEFYFFGEVSV